MSKPTLHLQELVASGCAWTGCSDGASSSPTSSKAAAQIGDILQLLLLSCPACPSAATVHANSGYIRLPAAQKLDVVSTLCKLNF
jgi:hypothetical protein